MEKDDFQNPMKPNGGEYVRRFSEEKGLEACKNRASSLQRKNAARRKKMETPTLPARPNNRSANGPVDQRLLGFVPVNDTAGLRAAIIFALGWHHKTVYLPNCGTAPAILWAAALPPTRTRQKKVGWLFPRFPRSFKRKRDTKVSQAFHYIF